GDKHRWYSPLSWAAAMASAASATRPAARSGSMGPWASRPAKEEPITHSSTTEGVDVVSSASKTAVTRASAIRLVARAAGATSEARGEPSATVQTARGRAKVSSVAFQRVAPPVWLATWSRRYRLASFAPGSIKKVLIVGVTGASAMWPRALFATSPRTGGGDA